MRFALAHSQRWPRTNIYGREIKITTTPLEHTGSSARISALKEFVRSSISTWCAEYQCQCVASCLCIYMDTRFIMHGALFVILRFFFDCHSGDVSFSFPSALWSTLFYTSAPCSFDSRYVRVHIAIRSKMKKRIPSIIWCQTHTAWQFVDKSTTIFFSLLLLLFISFNVLCTYFISLWEYSCVALWRDSSQQPQILETPAGISNSAIRIYSHIVVHMRIQSVNV